MQKFELKRTSGRLVACAVLALSGTAFAGSVLAAADSTGTGNVQVSAATATADSGKRMHYQDHHKRGHRHHRRMGDAAMLIPGYGPVPKDVVESLSLNADQTALLNEAKSFIKENRKAHRDQFRKTKTDSSSQEALTLLDPHAAVKKHEERFDVMREVREEGTQKWLALWDSLESGQQQTLSDYVATRNEQRAQRRAEYKEKRAARNKDKS